VLAAWLKKNTVQTIIGNLRFDGVNNFGDDKTKLKQLQNGEWVIVWPAAFAKPGVKLLMP
jgi:branched-chain amino acid transport system substrate-binding protein